VSGTRDTIAAAGDSPRFRPDEVPEALLTDILAAAARRVPARFVEPPWRFVVVVGRERERLVEGMAEALARHWGFGTLGTRGLASDAVLNAPALLLVFSAVPSAEGLEAFGVAAGVAQNVILLAHEAGLATHRIYSPHVVPESVLDFVGERLGPELRSSELVTMLAVGFPDGAAQPPPPSPPVAIGWIGRSDGDSSPARPSAAIGDARPAQVLRAPQHEVVLIADAYPYSREQLSSQLAAGGYQVEAFSDGETLLQRVALRGVPDLYVIGESMPDVSGFELVRRLLGGGAAAANAPIIITTARRDTAFRIAGLTAGVDYYLRKPVNPIELYTAVRILLERRRLLVELQHTNLQLGRLLSELRAAQARLVQQAKMASLGQLVAGVAHEINTPLGAVVSNNDLFLRCFARLRSALAEAPPLADREVAERIHRDMEAVESLSSVTREACARITGIVRTLRTFARVDVAEIRAVDLHEGIDSTLVLTAHLTKPGTVVVRRYGALPVVECHPNQINQVFMNLLVNACQAIDSDGTITITTRRAGERVEIAIADTGRGIAPEHLDRIFDPGFTTKDAGVGTGLGLMICYQIIEAHGGEITVESAVGKGTTFTVRLPIRPPLAMAVAST
jgi:signal transduction histidine kinase/nitroreductase